jgi:hypothetical protein
LRARLGWARETGRSKVLSVLGDGASELVTVDNGETLWGVYQATLEVDGWWSDV